MTDGLKMTTTRTDPSQIEYTFWIKSVFGNNTNTELSYARSYKVTVGCFDESSITAEMQTTANAWGAKDRLAGSGEIEIILAKEASTTIDLNKIFVFKTDFADCAVYRIRAYNSFDDENNNTPTTSSNSQAYLVNPETNKDLTTGKISPVIKTSVTDYTTFSIFLRANT